MSELKPCPFCGGHVLICEKKFFGCKAFEEIDTEAECLGCGMRFKHKQKCPLESFEDLFDSRVSDEQTYNQKPIRSARRCKVH